MNNLIGQRKQIYFPQDSPILQRAQFLASQQKAHLSPIVRELMEYGLKPYLEATGQQLPLTLATPNKEQ